MKQTLSLIVNNRPGVLVRVTGLFSRRRCNIVSLTVDPMENKELSEMTIIAEGNVAALEQVVKQSHKLIDVLQVKRISDEK